MAELLADVRWLLARLANGGPPALEADLSLSQDARAVATRQVIARVGHLLGDLGSQQMSESNRLTHLSVLPHIREQLSVPGVAEGSILMAKWPLPESRNSGLIRTLTGHTDWVTGIAIAPDGSWLASASTDETVRIWSIGESTMCAAVVRLEFGMHSVAIAEPSLVIACGGPNVYAFEFSHSKA